MAEWCAINCEGLVRPWTGPLVWRRARRYPIGGNGGQKALRPAVCQKGRAYFITSCTCVRCVYWICLGCILYAGCSLMQTGSHRGFCTPVSRGQLYLPSSFGGASAAEIDEICKLTNIASHSSYTFTTFSLFKMDWLSPSKKSYLLSCRMKNVSIRIWYGLFLKKNLDQKRLHVFHVISFSIPATLQWRPWNATKSRSLRNYLTRFNLHC